MIKKTQPLQIRLTKPENDAFKEVATSLGETRSRLARKMIRETVNNEIDLLTDEQSLLKIAIRQLIGIANNLNQITTAIHAGITHRSVDATYIQELTNYIATVKRELENAIRKTRTRWVRENES